MAWAGGATAQPEANIELRWVAPPTCPDEKAVENRIRRLLGGDGAVHRPEDRISAEGNVVFDGRYRLRLSVRRAREASATTRFFDSDSCDSLAGAAAVTLSLLARGDRAAEEPRAATEPTPLPTARSAPTTSTPAPGAPASTPAPPTTAPPTAASTPTAVASAPSSPPARDSPAPNAGRAGASVASPAEHGQPLVVEKIAVAIDAPLLTLDEGVLPSTAYGIGAAAGIRLYRLQLMVSGVLWLTQSGNASVASQYEGSYERRSGELSSCYSLRFGRLEVGPCVTTTLEDMTARGSGPDVVGQTGHTSWLTVGLAARAQWVALGWAALFLRPRLAFATSRPTFAIDGVGSLYRIPLAAVGIDLGCEWIL
jgi:hypothetical protein